MVAQVNGTAMEQMPDWIKRLDNLVTAIEIYRDIEEQAMTRIRTILKEKGISVSVDELQKADTDSIRERMNQAKAIRLEQERKEQMRYEEERSKREEERGCRR